MPPKNAGSLENIPTGVPGFDLAVGGGVPAGSFVILLGEAGAGHREFAYTSARGLHRLANGSGLQSDNLRLPERVCYISVTRTREDVTGEMARLFSSATSRSEGAADTAGGRAAVSGRAGDSPETSRFLQEMVFRDLSEVYFAGSNAPVSWIAQERPRTLASLKQAGRSLNILEELLITLNQQGPGAVVVLDSLTSLAHYCAGEDRWRDFLFFVEGLQRAAKGWRGLVLGLLDAATLDPGRQEQLLATADGVLRFQWEETPDHTRQRSMYVQTFRGLLPLLARDHVPKFEVSAAPGSGLEMAHVRLVAGRR